MCALQLKDTWGFHPDQSWYLRKKQATDPHQFQQAEKSSIHSYQSQKYESYPK